MAKGLGTSIAYDDAFPPLFHAVSSFLCTAVLLADVNLGRNKICCDIFLKYFPFGLDLETVCMIQNLKQA